MKRNTLLLIAALVLGAGFVAAVMMKKSSSSTSNASGIPKERLVKAYSPSLGNPDSHVTVVEFLDPECEACAAFAPTVKGLVNDYKDRIHFVVRYMLFHGNSQLAALATEAAGRQGKYWEMQMQLFHRKEWTHQETPQNEFFEMVAKDLGLDVEKFRQDMKDPQILANVQADFQEGPSLGVNGTPTFFVNGRILAGLSYEDLKRMIDEELAKKP